MMHYHCCSTASWDPTDFSKVDITRDLSMATRSLTATFGFR